VKVTVVPQHGDVVFGPPYRSTMYGAILLRVHNSVYYESWPRQACSMFIHRHHHHHHHKHF